MRSTQSGDTVMYNASSYKVVMDAASESLVAKLPGISVSSSGVNAHGRQVKRIMFDGREYFGEDVIAALKNLPANMVRRVEVVYKRSDEAELTGVDDGNSSVIINIVTNSCDDNTITGRFYGGDGHRNRYMAGGNTNFFGKEKLFSVLLQTNNVNSYNLVSGKRIDFVYMTGPLFKRVRSAEFIYDGFATLTRDPRRLSNFCHPSDHFPILITMKF